MGPYASHYLMLATQPFAEHGDLGKIVLRENFMKNVLVPDMGAFGSELNTKYCYLDYAFTETSASTLWTQAFGDVGYVTVEEFAEKLFEAFQPEIKVPAQNLMNNLEKSKSKADRPKIPFVNLDDYLKVRNPACESRRKLFLGFPMGNDYDSIGFWLLGGDYEPNYPDFYDPWWLWDPFWWNIEPYDLWGMIDPYDILDVDIVFPEIQLIDQQLCWLAFC